MPPAREWISLAAGFYDTQLGQRDLQRAFFHVGLRRLKTCRDSELKKWRLEIIAWLACVSVARKFPWRSSSVCEKSKKMHRGICRRLGIVFCSMLASKFNIETETCLGLQWIPRLWHPQVPGLLDAVMVRKWFCQFRSAFTKFS